MQLAIRFLRPFGALLLSAVALAANAADLSRGEAIYAANCVTCHGPQGRPDPDSPLVKSLGIVPANFSDQLFNSREPASDWKIVITHGGPALGFSEQMPAFGDALTEEDIDSVLAYIKTTLGGEHDYPDGELNLFLPIRTKKAFPEDEWVWKQRYTGQDGDNAWKNTLEYEFRIGRRAQGIMEVTHEVEGSNAEFGHLEPGFKYVLKHDKAAGFILTGAAQIGIPLNADANWELLPYLAVGKVLSDAFTFQGSGRLKLDLEDSDKSSAELAGIVHWTHTSWPRNVFPALEIVAEVPFDRGSGSGRRDALQFSVLPQARIGLNKRGNIALNVGVELPVNDTDRYDWRGYVYFIWDFADGGLLEGW
ncbi:c-type cytochrome [Elongatibacter sediminis]|uniref:Cytochrome c n=1 Tax=Elongatibacter sediminis TaxID=3119006 RepID=A0AAW9RK37_9GAMM